jgi:hypothetical protein
MEAKPQVLHEYLMVTALTTLLVTRRRRVKGATRKITDGQWIRVDGTQRIIEFVQNHE